MDDSNGSEPYITEIEFQPPSPDASPHLDLYNPDYINNSPFSTHSDLSFSDAQLPSLFADDYDPADFDNPHSDRSLLMFGDPQTDFYEYYRSPSPSGSENNEDTLSSASSTNPQFQSPNMSVAQSFENLSFHSPNWAPESLPSQKAPSPPRLVMPDPAQPPIIINVPEDNTDIGPSLHIVPATPVSGGGGVMNIASSRVQPRPWLEVNPNSTNSSRSPSPSHSLAATSPIPSRSPSASPQPPYLYDRSRRKSETSLVPPNWETPVDGQNFPQNHPPQQAYQSSDTRSSTRGANFAFGSSPSLPSNINHTNNGYLSPEFAEFNVSAGASIRRSKSDAGNTGLPRHRGSRSEDFRGSSVPGNTYLSPNAGHFLYPPTAHRDYVHSQQQQQNQHQDFMSGVSDVLSIPPSISHSQSLAPSMLPPPLGSTTPHGKHFRRASSGTRSERGVSAGLWDSEAVNSNRPSPYITPNASPRGRLVPLAADRQDEFNFSAIGIDGAGISMGRPPDDSKGPSSRDFDHQPLVVSKPNVTTGRTANASQKRRKQDATFICPVPGCGSTFTRSFNLKGHIRSHNEEKPFQCHWPGCHKGFARQHDCKRHEQLHTNYRPFNCEGCKKQFARMDALNRHLRSEGGAECLKLQEANGGGTMYTTAATPPSSSGTQSSATANNASSASSSTSSPPLTAAEMSQSLSASSTYSLGRQKKEPAGNYGNRGMNLNGLGDSSAWSGGGGGGGTGLSVVA